MITCKEFLEKLPFLNEVSPDEVLSHVKTCSSCEKEYEIFMQEHNVLKSAFKYYDSHVAEQAKIITRNIKQEKSQVRKSVFGFVGVAAAIIVVFTLYVVLSSNKGSKITEIQLANGGFIKVKDETIVKELAHNIYKLEKGSAQIKVSRVKDKAPDSGLILHTDNASVEVVNPVEDVLFNISVEGGVAINPLKKVTLITVLMGTLQACSYTAQEKIILNQGQTKRINGESQEKDYKEVINELLKQLGNDDPKVRDKAQEELQKYIDCDEKVNYLKSVVKNTEEEVKSRVNIVLDIYYEGLTKVLKVLYVESNARFEYHFLINALVRDNKGRLGWGLLLSADPEWPQPKPITKAEEVKFFPHKLESDKPDDPYALLTYDVVIFGDIHPTKDRICRNGKISNMDAMENLKRYVMEFGRGIIFIAGDRANPHNFKGTPLQDLLPFNPDNLTPPRVKFDREIKYVIAPDGFFHPVTKEVDPNSKPDDPPEKIDDYIKKVWEKDRPPLYWYTKIKEEDIKERPGCQTLVYAKTRQGTLPLIIWGFRGNGRVIFMATDETWRWRKLKGDAPYFYPFWQRAIDWVSREKIQKKE